MFACKDKMRILSFFLVGVFAFGPLFADIDRLVCVGLSAPGKNAVLDFAALSGAVQGKYPEIVPESEWGRRPAVIFGIPRRGNMLEGFLEKTSPLKNDGFAIESLAVSGAKCTLVLSNSDEGVANGAYALLKEMGVGLNLGASYMPGRLKAPKSFSESPALKIRGFLPWYNFLNSPTTWDLADHRAFVDDAIRIGANFIGFHTYDAEPLGAFEGKDGKMVLGHRLLSTSGRLWGTHPMKTEEFGFGTGLLYDREYFGTTVTSEIPDDREAILAEQKMVRDAFDYARSRGVKTCIGFEVRRNPFDEGEIGIFIRRLENVLESYPAADYIWLWQPEVWGATGFGHTEHEAGPYTKSLKYYARDMRDIFKRIVEHKNLLPEFDPGGELGRQARAMEGVRLAQYALVARKVLSRYKNPPRLVISGWGGDRRLASAEYYEGLDKLLPKDVIFSSLDVIGPIPRVDEIYNELPADRERWPIPWLENDGDQWQPQPYVKIYEGLMDRLIAGGSQGVLGIHWRTRCIGENFQYLCERAWNPSVSLRDFYLQYARGLYGDEKAAELAEIHRKLDAMPYRWVGGDGQVECAIFRWGGVGDVKYRDELLQIREKLKGFRFENKSAQANLDWLNSRIDWVLAYREMTVQANSAEELIAGKDFDSALKVLESPAFENGFRSYAARLSTRGEYGVLATVITKAYHWWLESYRLCAQNSKAGPSNPHMREWDFPERKIVLPRRFATIEENSPLELNPVILGGGDAFLLYKNVGEKSWKSKKLEKTRGWVRRAVIGADEIKNLPLMFTFSLDGKPGASDFPVQVVSVLPKAAAQKRERAQARAGKKSIALNSRAGKNTPVELNWTEVPGADYYRVLRDGKPLCATAFNYLPDAINKAECTYQVEAIADGRVAASSGKIKVEMPNTPISEAPKAEAESRNDAGVFIRVAAPTDSGVSKCAIFRKGRPFETGKNADQVFEHINKSKDYSKYERVGEVPVDDSTELVFLDKVAYGEYEYRLVFLNACDFESKRDAFFKVRHEPRKAPLALSLPLTEKPEGFAQAGDIEYGPGGADFSYGYIESDFRSSFKKGFTVSLEFRADSTEGMPVIASNGRHNSDGWYIQVMGGALHVSLGKNINTGVRPEIGKFYRVRAVFDGVRVRIFVDGKLTNDVLLGDSPKDSAVPLKVGTYEDAGNPVFKFKGIVRNLKIFAGVLDENQAGEADAAP